MKKNAVGWFEIYVDDMKRAKAFYEQVFNRTLKDMSSPEVQMCSFEGDMTSYGSPGALAKMQGFPAGRNSVLVYFSCEDCKQEEKRVTEFGGRVEKSKFAIGEYGFISLVYDTEGNMFGLHSMR